MMKLLAKLKRAGLIAVSLLVIGAPGSVVMADGCPPAPDGPGIHQPNGSDSSTYTYQCSGQYAGEWTNPYYVYNPADGTYTALYDQQFQYDCSAHQWTMLWWSYSPAQSSFYPSRIATTDVPDGLSPNCPTAPAGGSGADSSSTPDGNSQQAAISNTGTGSTNTVNNTLNGNSNIINNNTIIMHNGVVSQATTGNAAVIGNTVGGSALTGDSTSISSIANFLQSNSSIFGPDLANFVANINGDVNGDFMFDPSAVLSNTGTNSTNTANNNLHINTNNTNTNNTGITNNIDVGANSGDASVANNTKGGSASSGDAKAIVNLMNFINSSIASGKSFVGTININGNLNGDILLPPDLVNQLLAATGTNSTNTANSTTNLNSNDTNTNNTNISNNVTSNAQTGNANVSGNTTGGSATTGKANSNVTLLNLTGSQIVGNNNILVFVNVLGHWVGMIMNAPAGSTAASLGGGITQTGTNSNNAVNNNLGINETSTNTNNTGINNNVNVHAKSGNANVSGNTVGGDATSGDADTAVNIVNVSNSKISLANWFGILFINVFGNWTGSFGVNTSAGDPVAAAGGNQTSNAATSPSAPFQFVPSSIVPGASNVDNAAGSGSAGNSSSDGVVLAAKTIKNSATAAVASATPTTEKALNHFVIPLLGAGFAFIILFAGEHRRLKKY